MGGGDFLGGSLLPRFRNIGVPVIGEIFLICWLCLGVEIVVYKGGFDL